VGIFRRGSKDTSADLDPGITASVGGDRAPAVSADAVSTDAVTADADSATTTAPARRAVRRGGPLDRSEVKGLEGRLDLGALWLTGVPGMELRLEVEEASQNVVGVTAVLGESAVQLQAFAAPRSEGIWDDIRTEIAASITSQGGTADKTTGPLGAELRAQMPSQDSNGHTVFSPVRFVGVDGPRWFLRAVLSGPAAIDEGASEELLDVVRSTVVVRGDEAMAPRELLGLKLPDQPDPADEALTEEGAEAGQAPSVDDFKPFERGPEITEIH
jgi:hypothetical protein